ncbi:MAG: MtnX-like HAD-IB family phosphatase [Clostridia bacterium]|nr:MtnX-like HAD-IB family phosphatase [Clostridia bacterium]
MKKFAFVSDFDGTLTSRDFYHIVIDKYYHDWGRDFYTEWKKTKKINVEFLNKIFGAMGKTEEEIREEIYQLPFDPYAEDFIRKVQESGGDFYILSAGTSYYIKIFLQYRGIENVPVISMEGKYKAGGIEITPDRTSPYFSEVFGLDKSKVIKELKTQYEKVFFAGDSEPDLAAAKAADLAFAKAELKDLMEKEGDTFIPMENYKVIEEHLVKEGWLNAKGNE